MIRSWATVFLITKLKTLAKSFLAVRPEKMMRRKKRKKNRMGIAKLFALNANAKNQFSYCPLTWMFSSRQYNNLIKKVH